MLCSPRVHSKIQSQLSQWPTDIFPKWRSAPTPSSTQATSERSKCFKIAVWPQRGGGPHTPSLILLHISVGIVRIQKCSAVTGRPLWLERTHNALCCWCELLTAWAGPRQQRTALRSRQRGGIFDISPWWQPCCYSRFVLYASSLCGPTSPLATEKSDLDDKYFPALDCFGELHPVKPQQLFSRVVWHMLGVNLFSGDSFLIHTSGAPTTAPCV